MEQETLYSSKEQLPKRYGWWLPSLHFTGGLPYVIVFLVSLVFYNRMGESNGAITLSTSSFFIPFILRPVLGRFVSSFSTKRFWVLTMELALGLCMMGIAKSLTSSSWFLLSMLLLFFTASAAVIHDVAISRFYKLVVPRQHTVYTGSNIVFMFLSIVFGLGIPIMVAGNLEVLNRRVTTSWITTFNLLALAFFVLFVYHLIMLPRPTDKPSMHVGSGLTRRWWNETKNSFMQLPYSLSILFFLLLFLIPEGMFFRIAPLFLIDPESNGGLSLSPQELALAQGSVGAFAVIWGCILGIKAIHKWGLKRCIWWMVCAITFPKMLYIYLSYNFVSTLSVINVVVFVEQFCFGFGVMAYIYLLFHLSIGKYSTFRLSLVTAVTAFSLMASGWFTGILQEYVGYRHFFVIVSVANILPFVVTAIIHIDKKTGKTMGQIN